ncbi:MAG: hypothetical protein ACRD0W_12345 [Acidimicrobiales bacterium]
METFGGSRTPTASNAIPSARPSRAEVPRGGTREVLDNNFLASIEVPPDGPNPVAQRRRHAEVLVALVGGCRERVEELRLRYLRRLHRASDDFGATEGLRVVEAALSLIPYPEAHAPTQRRTRRSRRRWWRPWGTR